MNAERLLRYFDRLSEAPEAIPHLRRFILDLAVRGKLVDQDPRDEPASELLKRIEAEKSRLVKVGEIRKQEAMLPVKTAEIPFEVPSGWFPTRLAVVTVCLDYMREPINGVEREQRIAGKDQSELFPYFGATQQQGWIDDYIFDEELVLLGEDGVPYFDDLRPKAYLISGKTWVNNHAHVFRGVLVSHAFLVHCLNAFDYRGRVAGATRSKLNQAKALDIPIVLPPLAEQHRIVAKVDELMALCDQLEAAKTEREQSRDRLVAASLHRLNSPADAEEANAPDAFRDHARFIFNHLPRLTTRPEHIKQLRQTILNLAVRGKLVPQDPNDEPAGELLKRIQAEKARLVREGAIQGENSLPPVSEKEKAFDIPTRWQWARFVEYALDISTGPFGSALHQSDYVQDGVPLVNPSHMINGSIRPDRKVTVSAETAHRLATYRLREGDIVIARRGEVGRAAIVSRVENGWLCGTGSFFIRFQNDACREYIILLLRCEPVRKYLAGEAVRDHYGEFKSQHLKENAISYSPS